MEKVKLKWLQRQMEGFKDCNGIYKRKQHSKAALVNIEGVENRIIEL